MVINSSHWNINSLVPSEVFTGESNLSKTGTNVNGKMCSKVQYKVSIFIIQRFKINRLKVFWPFLAHLAFRPCELLPSLFVRCPSVNISHFNLLIRNHWANCNQTLVEWSLGNPLPKLCPVILTSNQDGHQAKNRKRGDEIKKQSSPLKLLSQSQPKICWNDPWVVPFQTCVWHFRPPTKMAATAELNLT
jgi:hypothetical protein